MYGFIRVRVKRAKRAKKIGFRRETEESIAHRNDLRGCTCQEAGLSVVYITLSAKKFHKKLTESRLMIYLKLILL